MAIESKLRLKSNVTIRVIEPGKKDVIIKKHNIVPTSGENYLADLLANGSGVAALMSHMAIGSDATPPAAGDTTLTVETARVALDSTANLLGTTTYAATFAPGVGTGQVEEAGILNDPTAGVMLARSLTDSITKGVDTSIIIVWDISFIDDGV
jgi:hypothetical protein